MKNLFWILFFIIGNVFANFHLNNNDGWIPIFPTNIDQYQETVDTSTPISYPKRIVEQDLPKVEFIEFTAPKYKIRESFSRKVKDVPFEVFDEEMCLEEVHFANKAGGAANIDLQVTVDDKDKSEINIKTLSPRKIKGIPFMAIENELVKQEPIAYNDNNLIEDKPEDQVLKDSDNLYEVTERVDDIIQSIEDTGDNERIGYFHEPQKPSKVNLTENFLSILSNYNIMVNEKLPNYALSRRNKVHNRLPTRLMHYPNNLRIPYGYNSLNHLPVDPVLAVFLSNYGYYLPGLYGLNQNYKNLYGYLASNNIHNNKPFGVYKIYSDTDSSH